MLMLAMVENLTAELSLSSVRMLFHGLDSRRGRPSLSMPRKVDPHKAAKQWAIAKAVVEASPGTAILCADESRICLLPASAPCGTGSVTRLGFLPPGPTRPASSSQP